MLANCCCCSCIATLAGLFKKYIYISIITSPSLDYFGSVSPPRVSVIAVAAGIDASLPWERKVWLELFLGLLLWRWLPRLQLDFELRAIAVCCRHLSLIKIRWHIREANEWMVSAWHCSCPPIKPIPTAYDSGCFRLADCSIFPFSGCCCCFAGRENGKGKKKSGGWEVWDLRGYGRRVRSWIAWRKKCGWGCGEALNSTAFHCSGDECLNPWITENNIQFDSLTSCWRASFTDYFV